MNELIDLKLQNKSAVIGIIGLGYVGLPLALRFSEAGFSVIGFDIDDSKIHSITNGKSYISHIDDKRIKDAINLGLSVTSDFSIISNTDAIIICVPTPLTKYNEPELSYIDNTLECILPYLKSGQLLSLESTTYPGTTEERVVPVLAAQGWVIGENLHVVYSPEREDPGNQKFHIENIPKVVGGITSSCLELGSLLYGAVAGSIVEVSTTQVAEMTKLLENIYRSVNIGLVNEMKIICDGMGIDIHEVIQAASTKPFGFTKFDPGPGLGGHCIPIDPFYLSWKARGVGINAKFIELAGEINSNMPSWTVNKIIEALNDQCKSVKQSKILVLGIAYKKNIDDARQSPALKIMELLCKKGAEIAYSDPHIPNFPKMRDFYFNLSSLSLTAQSIAEYDCVIIATDHDMFDYKLILKSAQLIIDTRNVFSKDESSVIRA
jgi:UDP-N-acetyl-D-glucosamine dehydrogenase